MNSRKRGIRHSTKGKFRPLKAVSKFGITCKIRRHKSPIRNDVEVGVIKRVGLQKEVRTVDWELKKTKQLQPQTDGEHLNRQRGYEQSRRKNFAVVDRSKQSINLRTPGVMGYIKRPAGKGTMAGDVHLRLAG